MKKRYSTYIKPISIITNLVIINCILRINLVDGYLGFWHILYTNISWLVVSYHLNFYNIRRYNKNVDVISRLLLQFFIFTFIYFAYYSLTNKIIDAIHHVKVLIYIYVAITIFRTLYFYALKQYRIEGKNLRNIIFVGSNSTVSKTHAFINNHPELGYKIVGMFHNNPNKKNYLGNIDKVFDYAKKNKIDEIICSISELSKDQIKSFIHFCDNNLVSLKLLPDAKDSYTTKMIVEYYDYIPVLTLRTIPFDDPLNQFLKRVFDIVFSFLIIVFLFSWLVPILYIFIKIESKGPLFFKQIRDGLNGNTFYCYKFRSMTINEKADDIQATRGDTRVTKTGRFIRKTSIDELPQFFNVFLGDMSVVGPRPHMLSQTKKYAKVVDKFMVRHLVKPGITGLAQVRGYRGEIEKNKDMQNRVRLDIFYIENWSFALDLKIMWQTIFNVFKGEDKAY